MGKTKVTEKFQVTIPKDIREKIGLMPGEIIEVEVMDEKTIVLKRDVVKNPLEHLIGKKQLFKNHIRVENVEEAAESNIH
ncbi:MAG: AbrB/MazE/SpoVT family DNA-binding domain-containing protein [Candidatus Njordarchaeia archaeon]|nr:AbrB/MazE/SpoVT family DNA-binding domain-containing protein [Candidatus Korarchaeota archaeon]